MPNINVIYLVTFEKMKHHPPRPTTLAKTCYIWHFLFQEVKQIFKNSHWLTLLSFVIWSTLIGWNSFATKTHFNIQRHIYIVYSNVLLVGRLSHPIKFDHTTIGNNVSQWAFLNICFTPWTKSEIYKMFSVGW